MPIILPHHRHSQKQKKDTPSLRDIPQIAHV